MKNQDYLQLNTDNPIEKNAERVLNKLIKNGFIAFIAGGYVRDKILHRKISDIDIGTNAKPDEIIDLFPKSNLVGKKFGVVIARLNNIVYEITTFRKDLSYSDGRHPDMVKFGSYEEDIQRRDFTINAMFFDITNNQIIDNVNGLEDIKNKIIRTVGPPEKRLNEDYLRMLRAIRFAAQLKFKLDDALWNIIKSNAFKIKSISMERIRDEFIKIIQAEYYLYGIELLLKSNLIEYFLPELLKLKDLPQPVKFHPEGDVLNHTLLTLKHLKHNKNLKLRIAGLLHDIGKLNTIEYRDRIRFNKHNKVSAKITKKILTRMKFPNKFINDVYTLVYNHMKFIDIKKMRQGKLRIFLFSDLFPLQLELYRADCLASHNRMDTYRFIRKKIEEFKNLNNRPKPLINGNDLIKIGIKPGPIYKKILNSVYLLQLENKIHSKNDAVTYIKNTYKNISYSTQP